MKTLRTTPKPLDNRLLAVLPLADRERLREQFDLVTLSFGEVLMEPGDSIKHVYFPNDSLVSLLTLVDRHHALEVGMVGREGMVGAALGLGANTTPVRALVQGSGKALRMRASNFRKEMQHCAALQRGVLSYVHALMMQVAQTAACNRFHAIDTRLARWLLMTRDRVGSDRFPLTQEFLGHMLGVRRAGVTEAAQGLKQRKLVKYSRGVISIIDGPGLESASCSCYLSTEANARSINSRSIN
jgi:CRP-like cAMP-binding protein